MLQIHTHFCLVFKNVIKHLRKDLVKAYTHLHSGTNEVYPKQDSPCFTEQLSKNYAVVCVFMRIMILTLNLLLSTTES